MENFGIAILSAFSTISLSLVGVFIFRSWIIERLRWSIKHKYDMKILEVEHQKEIRLKGEVVAELFAQWIRKNGKLDYYELNRLSFQAFLWLPKDLAEELSECLSHTDDAKDIRTLLSEIRKYLHGSDDGFEAKNIIVFTDSESTKKV